MAPFSGSGGYAKDEIIALLGPPDAIAKPGDFLFKLVEANCEESCEVVVYYWRGAHDFLYFQCVGQKLGWWPEKNDLPFTGNSVKILNCVNLLAMLLRHSLLRTKIVCQIYFFTDLGAAKK